MAATALTSQNGLARRRLGVVHLVFFTVAASAPLTVLGGGVTTTYAVTGNLGVPLSFLVLGAVLAIFAVGYAAMSRHVANAGAFYSYLANGLGRATGVSGSFVALTAYNAIQIGLYGLFGAIFGSFAQDKFGVALDWWMWALIALALVGVLGLLRVDLNATVLAVLLVVECLAVVIFDLVSFTHPAGGSISTGGFRPSSLFTEGIGAVFALGIAAFTGFESAAIYSEEVKDPRRTVARSTYVAVAFTAIFYALSAWAFMIVTGPDKAQQAAQENGPGVVFGALAQYAGTVIADIANLLFITSVFAALLSFHNGVARYLFALGRERALPEFLGRTGVRSAAPVAGSLAQSALAFVVVLGFVLAGKDPVTDLFTWLSGIAAVGVVLLMAGTSAAVVGYFHKRGGDESVWQRTIAPGLATALLTGLLGILVANFDALLAPTNPPHLRWLLPGLVGAAAVIGLIWGITLRNKRPAVYEGIGRSATQPVSEADRDYVPVGG